MKKILAALIILAMIVPTTAFAAELEFTGKDAAYVSEGNVTVAATSFSKWHFGGYVGFKDVDLTGVNSVILKGTYTDKNGNNGDTLSVRLDSPTGKVIGYVHINKGGATEFKGAIEKTEGVHDVYLQSQYSHHDYAVINSIVFSPEVVTETPYTPVPESAIIDTYHDTWVAVDDYGRKIADYEEAGDYNEEKISGMFYWIWHTQADQLGVQIPAEKIKQAPEAKDDYFHPIWEVKKSFWSEPLLGFYSSLDYWVYRKHAVMLKNAGIDVIFFDFTNNDNCFANALATIHQAFRDSRASGVDAPKICYFDSWSPNVDYRRTQIKFLYLNYFKDGLYSDLWFYWNGKPLLFGSNIPANYSSLCLNPEDPEEVKLMEEISDFFTFVPTGSDDGSWAFVEPYPQHLSYAEDGSVEAISVGMAKNQSYVKPNLKGAGVFSDPYSKGKAYSEGFGDDLRPEAAAQMYFFREEAGWALEHNPRIMLFDGWNEWATGRQQLYNGFVNAFVDTFDDESSRDFEPSRGAMGDGHYNMLVDLVRKHEGARPAPVATGAKTIDVAGDIAQWVEVGPLFINDDDSYERDADGYQPYHYTTTVVNSIESAKVSFDAENLYFMVKARGNIVKHDDYLRLYINIDRNPATGWKGYDYLVDGGKLKAFNADGTVTDIADVTANVAGEYMTLSLSRSVLAETGTVDLEFKWVDGVRENGDILLWYTDGSVAPMGRFNYLYTEIQQKSLYPETRAALKGTSVFKAGANKMVVSGGKMDIYEPDTRVTAIERNGTLYVPEIALNDIMGYGRTKTIWDYERGMLKVKNYTYGKEGEIENYKWVYTTLNSYDVKVNGSAARLTNPIIAENGVVYVPLTLLSDCFGYNVSGENGIYYVTTAEVDASFITSAANIL